MVVLEKLTTNDIDGFKEIYDRSLIRESYDKKFFEYYSKQNLISRFVCRRFLYLLKYNKDIIGYLWYDSPLNSTVLVWALFVDDNYIDILNSNILNLFGKSTLLYEAIDNKRNYLILNKLGFIRTTSTVLMKLNTINYDKSLECEGLKENISSSKKIKHIIQNKYNISSDAIKISLFKFKQGVHESLRCSMQNAIFSSSKRIKMTVDDILYDMKQDYYLQNLCYFIKLENLVVGYGQVIYQRNKYTIVNFGIIKEFRNNNLGKLLLDKLITSTMEIGIRKIYIRVDDNNINAKKLYTWCGFKKKCYISKWQRN